MAIMSPPVQRQKHEHEGLFVDHDGKIADEIIEQTFLDFFEGEPDDTTMENLTEYVRRYYPDVPAPPANVCTDALVAVEWAQNFGALTIWIIDDPKVARELPGNEDGRVDIKYGGKIGPHGTGQPVAGSSVVRVAMLAVVQVIREIASAVNNQGAGDTTH